MVVDQATGEILSNVMAPGSDEALASFYPHPVDGLVAQKCDGKECRICKDHQKPTQN